MQRIVIIVLIAASALSCEEGVRLDLRQTPSRIVIEALVTDQPGRQYVRITRSADFYSEGKTPRVTDADVRVTDGTGETYSFIHNPRNHPDSLGYYLPSVSFIGSVGNAYSLYVSVDGEVYEASDVLYPVSPIDSLSYRLNEDQQEDPRDPGKIYELLVFAREPQDQENYYLFKYYRNDSLALFNNTDIYFSDDDLLAEQIDGIPSPVYYAKEDEARLEIYSLTRAGFIYYNDLFTLLNSDSGGMFSAAPAPPRTNISNNALGFFQVSSLKDREIRID